MSLLKWKDEYLLGMEALDYEHQDLFDCLNQIYQQCSRKADYDTVAGCLGRLQSRLSAHFALEEHTMREMKNPHYAAHKAEHDRFLDEVTGAVAAFREEFEHEDVDKLAHRVQEWIVKHITTFDRQLIERGR
ncbi:MAG: bacteriohemerythrin [Gammaproteobacteria bacterium]|nr:bacteriohemerythrin [Gammaproteobacteria bacterium]MDH3413071.1 bacteriohemerythrin [Gammaproteobacteria bacterium]